MYRSIESGSTEFQVFGDFLSSNPRFSPTEVDFFPRFLRAESNRRGTRNGRIPFFLLVFSQRFRELCGALFVEKVWETPAPFDRADETPRRLLLVIKKHVAV